MSRESLDDLALRHGTDKASGRHNFARIYDRYFRHLRDEPVTLVEIGVKHGASVRMWKDYFARGRVIGIDNRATAGQHAEDRIEIFTGSQDDAALLDAVVEASGPIDIVVDDGSHRYPHQRATLLHLWEHVKPDGIYVMEDVHTSYQERYGMGYRQRDSTIEFLKDLVDDLHPRAHKQPTVLSGLGSASFFPQTCILTKR